MTPDRAFDLIVLGGGPAGTSGARARLRRFGHRVVRTPRRSDTRRARLAAPHSMSNCPMSNWLEFQPVS
jgi:2-polyprenyl-6-methoxyphenol hydroxylase-like FAD-dependent oxidoreductase